MGIEIFWSRKSNDWPQHRITESQKQNLQLGIGNGRFHKTKLIRDVRGSRTPSMKQVESKSKTQDWRTSLHPRSTHQETPKFLKGRTRKSKRSRQHSKRLYNIITRW